MRITVSAVLDANQSLAYSPDELALGCWKRSTPILRWTSAKSTSNLRPRRGWRGRLRQRRPRLTRSLSMSGDWWEKAYPGGPMVGPPA